MIKLPKIKIKDLVLGVGKPKIAVPLVGTSLQSVIYAARQIGQQPAIDLVEWRIDFLSGLNNIAKLVDTAHQLQSLIAPRPLLITLRTQVEGGHFNEGDQAYANIYQELLENRCMDLIDLEITAHSSVVIQQLVKLAHRQNAKVIMSSHDFKQTPPPARLTSCLHQMERAGGDIAKIAVMPKNTTDILRLLEVTNDYHLKGKLPLISMSMGQLGKITRISGELFGSCITFASLSQASAPGQIRLESMKMMIDELSIKDN